ncbi:MAG: transferase, partial [Verrucomicrobia bacterium]|nr:transferase [Verrucomicrobiota bacterium]
MKRLLIIGAGGFGREVLQWARASIDRGRDWEPGGFLDDRACALEGPGREFPPIVGTVREYEPREEDVFVCALGSPRLRAQVFEHFKKRGARFVRVVHPSCHLGEGVTLGEGVILCPGVVLTCDIAIGANTALNVNTAVGHDARIGAHCQISSFCDLTGYVRLGDRVFLGSRASVLPGIHVGDGATVGAG